MKRSKHNLSFNNLMTGSMGTLYPVGCVEVLPGDTFQHRCSVFLRSMPLLAPVMHSVTIGINHFFVPNRLVWNAASPDNWEEFITGGNDGNNAATIPIIDQGATPLTTHPLLGYLGIPPVANLEINALAIRGFNMIFNEFFRDQDLVTARTEDDCTMPRVAWNRDRFTTARPWTQRGAAVSVPISGMAQVMGVGPIDTDTFSGSNDMRQTDGSVYTANDVSDNFLIARENAAVANAPGIFADLSTATAGDVNDWRLAFALQRYKEARAKYGARYTEYLRYLGIRSSDARLDRPEFLSGSRQTIAYSEVLQTASETTPSGDPQAVVGAMKGHGISAMRGNKYRRFFEEHGHVITTLFVRPKSIYQNMLERKWKRTDKESYWQKELQQIGQDELKSKEVFAEIDESTAGANDNGDTILGYVDRYSEYKANPSYVCGQYRTDAATSLDHYHFARELASRPTLNAAFIECNPTKRVFPVTTEDVLWASVSHSLVARRMVTKGNASRII